MAHSLCACSPTHYDTYALRRHLHLLVRTPLRSLRRIQLHLDFPCLDHYMKQSCNFHWYRHGQDQI